MTTMMRLLTTILLALALPAQKVEVTNHTDNPLVGWFQCNVDSLPPHASGSTTNCNFVVGKRTGLDTHNIDVWTIVQAREHLVIDLSTAWFGEFGLPPPPENNYLGGVPIKIAGVRMEQFGAEINGAGYDFSYRARVGPMLVVHLFLHWYPHRRGWCRGEVVITASNPTVPDVIGGIPANFKLQIGDANVFVPGLGQDPNLMEQDDWLADGQRRALPLTIVWPELYEEHDAHTASAWCRMEIGIRGVQKLLMEGNPPLPDGFDAANWAMGALPDVVARQHDWLNSKLDPAVDSGATGAQGSQPPGVAGPAMAHPLAVMPIYVTALDTSWPMFHLEADGSTLDWKGHPGLHLNRGRVNRAISADVLGKPFEPNSHECHRHSGPEWEHWFDWNLFAGARFMGTPATQLALEAHAVHFLHNFNVPWSPPSRGIGWYSFLAVELYRGLENRELAEAVANKWRELWVRIIKPRFENGGFWSWSDDPRLGGTAENPRAVPWQAAVGVWGVNMAAFCFTVPEAWELCGTCVSELMERAYVKKGGWWTSRNVIAFDGTDPEGAYVGEFGYYDNFGMPLAVACTLRLNPGHWFALEIWAQLKQDTDLGHYAWLVPLGQ